MSHTETRIYDIRSGDTKEEREPTVGKWYCAASLDFDYDEEDNKQERVDYGVIAQYVGDGEFYDGDTDETRAMLYADWLIEQN